MKKATLRFIEEKELNVLTDLIKEHRAFEKAEVDLSPSKTNLAQHLFSEQPALFCLVAEKDHQIVGYASYMKQFSTWDAEFYLYLDCLYLREEARGQGLGQIMMQRLKVEAQNLNCKWLQWQTPVFNANAINFYKKLGARSLSKERFFLETEAD